MRLARIPIGLTGLLIDQQFGLLPNAPVYLVALGSLVSFARQQRRLAIELLAIAMPYVIAVAAFHMWWAGLSSPARFLVPVLLPMAMPVAAFWNRHASTTPRAFTSTLLAISVGITALLACAGDGSLLYNTRDGYARWLEWIAPAANLAHALPSLFQGTVASAWSLAAVWLGAIAAGWLALRALERRPAGLSFLAVALVTVAAVSLGASGGWLASRSAATEPGSSAFTMLSEACGRTPAFFRVAPFALSATRLDAMAFGVNDAGRRPIVAGGPIWTGRNIPPGRYRLLLDSGLNATGALTIALGRQDAVLQRCDFTDHPARGDRLRRRSASRCNPVVDDARHRAAIVGRGSSSSADRAGNGGNVRTEGRPRRRQRLRRHVFATRRRLCRGHRVVGAGRKGRQIDGAAARRADPVCAQRSVSAMSCE